MPRKVQPKLSKDQLLSLEMLHLEVVAAIEDGSFTYEQCYSWLGSCVLWLFVGVKLRKSVGVMQDAVKHAEAMLQSYHNGKLELDNDDIDLIKFWVDAMAYLAKHCTLTVASTCADIAENRVNNFIKELNDRRKDQQQQSSG